MKGRTRAHEALNHITAAGLLGNEDCKTLLGVLADQAGGGATAASIALALEAQAKATYNSWTIYDGPSASTVSLDPAKFANAASGNIKTVADWFGVSNGRQGLSQQNGNAIFLRSDDWGGFYNPYTSIDGDVNSYGYGTLVHELLHKTSVGGFTHDQMNNALEAVGFTSANNALGKNLQSAGIGSKCF